jgi:hypothetical protein
MNRHEKIIKALLKSLETSDPETYQNYATISTDGLLRLMFWSYRTEKARGFRLTPTGYDIMRRGFECWTTSLPEGFHLTNQHIIFLAREMKMPWFIEFHKKTENKRHEFVCFDPDFAMRIRLHGGDLTGMATIQKQIFADGRQEKPL